MPRFLLSGIPPAKMFVQPIVPGAQEIMSVNFMDLYGVRLEAGNVKATRWIMPQGG